MTSKFKTAKEVKDAMFEKAGYSGLDSGHIHKLEFAPFTADEVAPKLGLSIKKAGFLLPYFDFTGQKTEFWRFRFLEPTTDSFGGKDVRYMQAKKSLNEIYLPPFMDWEELSTDTSKPLIITEGELKAACACAAGLPTIGLGGVWCFRSSAAHVAMLPQLSAISWSSRVVYICYDSDAASNSKVIAAENALARELVAAGARPMIVRLPSLCPPMKTGLDDFLVSEGVEALQDCIRNATPWKSAQELHCLNEEVVYVNDPGLILRLDNLQRLSPRAFVDHAFATRRYLEEVVTEKSVKMVEKSAAKEWLQWPQRATVERVTYAPGKQRITDSGELNIWRGWGCVESEGDIKPWQELLGHLFSGHEKDRKWFEQWLAYPLQNPGEKMSTCALLWSRDHGLGKSTIGYSMFKIYGDNATEITDKDLQNGDNDWAENKQFILGDEITGGDKRATADRMKSRITQKLLRINVKYVPRYTVPDCVNYLFTSNHPDAFFLEDKDRRFFIHEIKGQPLTPDFYKRYYKWLNGSGSNALFHHLLHLDVSDFDPQAPAPMTASKKDMIDNGRSDLGSWVSMLRETPESVLRLGDKELPYALWTSTDLLTLYDVKGQGKVTANGLARELARAGFERCYNGMPVPTSLGPQRLWVIKEFNHWAMTGPQLGKLYTQERGLKWQTSSKS